MNDRKMILITVAIAGLIGCSNDNGEIWGYRYRSDMREQPSFKKHEDPLPPVKNAIPVREYESPLKDSISAARLLNRVKMTPVSADTAKFLFETYCTPCHGYGGKGDGLVAEKFQKPPDLITSKYRNAPDGYIYYVIRNGYLIMPPYYEAIKSRERWLIVNHLRTLQK